MLVRTTPLRLLPKAVRPVFVLCATIALALAACLPGSSVTNAAVQATPSMSLTKTLIEPRGKIAQVGDAVVFQITLANTGSTTITKLPLADSFESTKLKFVDATIGTTSVPPSVQSTNVISWTDLTLLPGVSDLAPGASVSLRTTFKALEQTKPGAGASPETVSSQVLTQPQETAAVQANPNDYYNLETRFLVDKAIDDVNGGVYLAVRGDGTPWGRIPANIYGFPSRTLMGTMKHPGGQGICMEYFIREYQRLTQIGNTVATENHGVLRPLDMLNWAKGCADFVDNHMIIGSGQNEPATLPPCVPGVGNKCMYYWGFVNAAGTSGHLAANGANIPNYSAPSTLYLSDSFVAWNVAELALTLQSVGDPAYVTYKQNAIRFWNWMKTVKAPYMPPANAKDPKPADYAGRDRFLPDLGMTLYELSVAEGAPDPSFRNEVLDCVNGQNEYAAPYEMNQRCLGESYTTGYGRSAAHAMEIQHRGVDNYISSNRNQIWHNYGNNEDGKYHYGDDPSRPQNPFIPFAHGGGREYVAGLQRSHWFYYTFPDEVQPKGLLKSIAVPGAWTIQKWSRTAIIGYWNYANTNMWDATAGQQAWWDSQSKEFKPCFSLGTPVPLADWKAPVIGNKIHTLNPDGSALITMSGVYDPDWPYLNWKFRGIGVEEVLVYYSVDNGATWQSIPASETAPGSTNYVATIPPQSGKTVFYYAAARDVFGNISTFPSGAPALYQVYTTENVTYNIAWSTGASDSNGTPVPPTQGGDKTPVNPPGTTAVTLSRFEARSQTDGVLVQWQTSSERNTYGFKLYRSDTVDRSGATLLTSTAIPGRGRGTSTGATYNFTDTAHSAGYYWLEEIDLDAKSTWYGPVTPALQSTIRRVYLPAVLR